MGRLGRIMATAVFAVLTVFVTVVPAQAATLHPFHTTGQAGVEAHGNYARSSLNGRRTVAIRPYIYDGLRDGKYAGVEIHWKGANGKTDIKYVWNPHGAGTTAQARVQSYYYLHLYIRECIGVNATKWHPTNCGPFQKLF